MCELFIKADARLWESTTRSLRIDGMVTSVRLENFFWSKLEEIATRDGMNVVQLITRLHHFFTGTILRKRPNYFRSVSSDVSKTPGSPAPRQSGLYG